MREKVVSLGDDSSVSDLLEAFGDVNNLKSLRFGFPPQVVDIDEQGLKTKLDELGISSGEKVTLVLGSESTLKTVSQARKLRDDQISLEKIWPGMILQVHPVPDDNSCLFHAISYCVKRDISTSQELREEVATQIANDPVEYSDAILGRPNREYTQWILKHTSWGGGIELAILSRVLKTCIMVLDMDACKFERFNDDHFDAFIIVAFNGVHYDAMEAFNEKTGERVTVFSQRAQNSKQMLARAQEVAATLKRQGYSFNTARDRIRCNVCSAVFVGEREVARHAEKTNHVDFGQS